MNLEDDYSTHELDDDYIFCSVSNLLVLRSSDARAVANRCCLDCYYDVILKEENNRDDD